jgi:predicted enzyme related to lactoylglutathione lyase
MHAAAAAGGGERLDPVAALRNSRWRAGRLRMPRPVHFELTAENVERAKEFYSKVFGWTFQKWGDDSMPYWLTTTGPEGEPGINGGIMLRQQGMGPGTTNTMGVESVDAAVEAIKAAGGQIIMEKMAVPGMGWVAYGTDTEGNQLGVFQMDSSAA